MNKRVVIGLVVIFLVGVLPAVAVLTYFNPDVQMERIYERNRLMCEDYEIDHLKHTRGEITDAEFIENEQYRLNETQKLLEQSRNLPDTLEAQRIQTMLVYRIQGSEILIQSYYQNKNRWDEVYHVWLKSKKQADLYVQGR